MAEGVGLATGVALGVALGVGDGVAVGLGVAVGEGVAVGVAVGDGVGLGADFAPPNKETASTPILVGVAVSAVPPLAVVTWVV